jgi:hypothetical protein
MESWRKGSNASLCDEPLADGEKSGLLAIERSETFNAASFLKTVINRRALPKA